MRKIDLKEYERSEPERLSAAEIRTLQASELSIGIVPTGDAESEYYLTPGSIVGAVEIGDLSVLNTAQDQYPTAALARVLRDEQVQAPAGAVRLPR